MIRGNKITYGKIGYSSSGYKKNILSHLIYYLIEMIR